MLTSHPSSLSHAMNIVRPLAAAIEVRSARSDPYAEQWERVHERLNEWLLDPAQTVDRDAIPPDRTTIREARNLIPILRQLSWPPPAAVLPDSEGGVSFEFYAGGVYKNVEVLANGEIWLTTYPKAELPSRLRFA